MTRDRKRMSKKDDLAEYMSAEELKSKFYDYFRDSGTFADLRTQLRSKLVNEMFKVSPTLDNMSSNDDTESSLLPLQVGNWLVYDHMKRLGLEYSVSTFASEAHLPYPKKLLSIKDILHIFGMDRHSPEYDTILSAYVNNNKESFLHIFVSTIMKKKFSDVSKESPKIEAAKSTTDKEPFSLSEYFPSKVLNERFNDYNPTFKETDSETILYKQLKLEKDKHEREIQQLRQKLLMELDTLYGHEQEARIEIERRKMKLVHEQELLDLQKEKLQMKELELNGRLKSLEIEAQEKVNALKESFSLKQKELDEQESHLLEMQQRLKQEQIELKSKDIQSEAFETKYIQLQKSYKTLQDEYTVILKENGKLQAELKQVSDYSIIKEELIWKSKKLERYEKELMLLRAQLHEERLLSLHTIQKLQQQMMSEISMLHTVSLNVKASTQDNQPANSEDKPSEPINESSQQYKELLTRIEDQRQDIQELHRLVHNLHYKQPAKDHLAELTASPPTKDPEPVSPVPHIDQKPLNPNAMKQKLFEETNQRIAELIKETDAMEQKYSDYMFSRPNLYPNIYIPYNPMAMAARFDVKAPNDKLSSSCSNFSNFDLEFGSKTYYNPEITKPVSFAAYPRNEGYSNHMQDFLNLLHRDVTLSQPNTMTANKSEASIANQTFLPNTFSLQPNNNFTLSNTIGEKLVTNEQKSVFPGAFEFERETLHDITRTNASNHLVSEQATGSFHHQLENNNTIHKSPTSTSMVLKTNSNASLKAKVSNKTEVRFGDKNISEQYKTKISEDSGNSELHTESKIDDNENKMSGNQNEIDLQLNKSLGRERNLASGDNRFLEPITASQKRNDPQSSDSSIDLDAMWKQQSSKPKDTIFKINSNVKNIYTVGTNKTNSTKTTGTHADKAKRKLSFEEILKDTPLSPLNSAFDKSASQLNTISKDMSNLTVEKDKSLLNPTLEKNVSLLNPEVEKDISVKNLVSETALALSSLALKKDTSFIDPAAEKGTSQLNSVSEPGLIQDLVQETSEKSEHDNANKQHNPISIEEPTPPSECTSIKEQSLSLIDKVPTLGKNSDVSLHSIESSDSVHASIQNSGSEKKESLHSSEPRNGEPLHGSEPKNSEPLHDSEPKNSEPLHDSEPKNSEPLHDSEPKNSEPLHDSEPKNSEPLHGSELKNGEPLHDSELKNSEPLHDSEPKNGEPLHDSELKNGEPLHGSELKNSEPLHGSELKNSEPLRGTVQGLEPRNSVSEIGSSELDEKDSSDPNASELSALNLSAGSELEEIKGEEEEDGW